jgi:hypothetical protein
MLLAATTCRMPSSKDCGVANSGAPRITDAASPIATNSRKPSAAKSSSCRVTISPTGSVPLATVLGLRKGLFEESVEGNLV